MMTAGLQRTGALQMAATVCVLTIVIMTAAICADCGCAGL
jgi:hypothetical protein